MDIAGYFTNDEGSLAFDLICNAFKHSNFISLSQFLLGFTFWSSKSILEAIASFTVFDSDSFGNYGQLYDKM